MKCTRSYDDKYLKVIETLNHKLNKLIPITRNAKKTDTIIKFNVI